MQIFTTSKRSLRYIKEEVKQNLEWKTVIRETGEVLLRIRISGIYIYICIHQQGFGLRLIFGILIESRFRRMIWIRFSIRISFRSLLRLNNKNIYIYIKNFMACISFVYINTSISRNPQIKRVKNKLSKQLGII